MLSRLSSIFSTRVSPEISDLFTEQEERQPSTSSTAPEAQAPPLPEETKQDSGALLRPNNAPATLNALFELSGRRVDEKEAKAPEPERDVPLPEIDAQNEARANLFRTTDYPRDRRGGGSRFRPYHSRDSLQSTQKASEDLEPDIKLTPLENLLRAKLNYIQARCFTVAHVATHPSDRLNSNLSNFEDVYMHYCRAPKESTATNRESVDSAIRWAYKTIRSFPSCTNVTLLRLLCGRVALDPYDYRTGILDQISDNFCELVVAKIRESNVSVSQNMKDTKMLKAQSQLRELAMWFYNYEWRIENDH